MVAKQKIISRRDAPITGLPVARTHYGQGRQFYVAGAAGAAGASAGGAAGAAGASAGVMDASAGGVAGSAGASAGGVAGAAGASVGGAAGVAGATASPLGASGSTSGSSLRGSSRLADCCSSVGGVSRLQPAMKTDTSIVANIAVRMDLRQVMGSPLVYFGPAAMLRGIQVFSTEIRPA